MFGVGRGALHVGSKTLALKREYAVEDPVYLAAPYKVQGRRVALRDAVREASVLRKARLELSKDGG